MSHHSAEHEPPAVPSDHLAAVTPPGGVDCTAVLADVFLYLDHEGDVGARERIQVHLDECTPCFRQYGLEREIKSLIARCCGGDRAPESLRSSIRLSLTSVTVEGTTVETSRLEYRREV